MNYHYELSKSLVRPLLARIVGTLTKQAFLTLLLVTSEEAWQVLAQPNDAMMYCL